MAENLVGIANWIENSQSTIGDDGYVTNETNVDYRAWSYGNSQWHLWLEPGMYWLSIYVKTPTSASAALISVIRESDGKSLNAMGPSAFSSTGQHSVAFRVGSCMFVGIMMKPYLSETRVKLERAEAATEWTPLPDDVPVARGGWLDD